jgi:hypothetical protein
MELMLDNYSSVNAITVEIRSSYWYAWTATSGVQSELTEGVSDRP